MRILFTICLICSLSVASFGQGSVRFLVDDYEYAIEKAKKEKKLVFIDTYASWCKPCKKQEPVFRDRSVAQFFNDHFVNVKVNMDNDLGKALALKYSVIFLPTLMIVDHHGNVRYRSDQRFSADALTAEELIRIAERTVYPERAIASTITPNAPKPAQAAVAVKTTPTTSAKPKYRHVQHTPLDRYDKKKDSAGKATVSQKTSPVTNKTSQAQTTASDISTADGEKILYVLGQGDDMPPEVLREEAYFRFSLMDGSHKEAAKKYLSTQEDWSEEVNMKFLFDFLYTTRSDEFTYLIINRHKFEKLLGKEKVANSMDILVNQTLDGAYPRPDHKEAQALYSYLDPYSSKDKAMKYHLNVLLDEKEIDKFIPLAKTYLEEMDPSDADMMLALANTIAESSDKRKSLKYAMKLVDKTIKIRGSRYEYLDSKAFLYYKMGDKRKAYETAQLAIALAKSRGISYDSTLELLKLIEEL